MAGKVGQAARYNSGLLFEALYHLAYHMPDEWASLNNLNHKS